jgi:hypothetical protein
MEGRTENFTPRGIFTSRGQNSPQGGQLRPWCQSLPLGAKLRKGLCCFRVVDVISVDKWLQNSLPTHTLIFKTTFYVTFLIENPRGCGNAIEKSLKRSTTIA